MRIITALALLVASLAPTAADERIGSFVLLDDAPNAIMLAGDITSLTPLDFKKALIKRPEADLLVLGSAGGNMVAGLLLADDVHQRDISTYVPSGLFCYSACSYVFFGGKNRLAAGDLGVHQFSGPDGGDDASAQIAVADMLQIMHRFDVSQDVLDRMLRTAADDIHVFSSKEIVDYSVNRNAVDVRLMASVLDDRSEDSMIALVAEYTDLGGSAQQKPSSPAPVTAADRQRTESTPIPAFAVFAGVDFYGGDVAKMSVPDIGKCTAACMDHDQCTALTFNTTTRPSRGPNCFLKDGIGEAMRFEGAISGTFMDASRDMSLQVGKSRMQPTDVLRSDD